MPAGGKRVGAGRPTKAAVAEKKAAAQRNTAEFSARAVRHLGQNYDTLQQLADGIWFEEETGEGKRRVYRAKPDKQALMYLVDHGKGKAAQAANVQQETTITIVSHVPRPRGSTLPLEEDENAPIEAV